MAKCWFNSLLSLVQWITNFLLPWQQKRAGSGIYPRIYHERQRQRLCLLHALNNMLQKKVFTRKELDEIADTLGALPSLEHNNWWWTPFSLPYSIFQKRHRSLLGDYDVNVLNKALDTRNFVAKWQRKGVYDLKLTATCKGIILNIRGILGRRHWVAMSQVEGQWYKLDSLRAEPLLLPNGEEDLKKEIDSVFDRKGNVFFVFEEDVVLPE